MGPLASGYAKSSSFPQNFLHMVVESSSSSLSKAAGTRVGRSSMQTGAMLPRVGQTVDASVLSTDFSTLSLSMMASAWAEIFLHVLHVSPLSASVPVCSFT